MFPLLHGRRWWHFRRFEGLLLSLACMFLLNIIFPGKIYGGTAQACYLPLQLLAGINLYGRLRPGFWAAALTACGHPGPASLPGAVLHAPGAPVQPAFAARSVLLHHPAGSLHPALPRPDAPPASGCPADPLRGPFRPAAHRLQRLFPLPAAGELPARFLPGPRSRRCEPAGSFSTSVTSAS